MCNNHFHVQHMEFNVDSGDGQTNTRDGTQDEFDVFYRYIQTEIATLMEQKLKLLEETEELIIMYVTLERSNDRYKVLGLSFH